MNRILVKNLSKKFEDKSIVKNINFQFDEGMTYLIRGESGIGKTTFLNMLAGYVKPDSGNIEFSSDLTVGYLFQDEMLFSNLTVKENLLIKYYALKEVPRDFDEMLENILAEIGIIALRDRKIAMLSGGERQRVQLASILFSNPDVLLMDEPTSKLDEINKQMIVELINKIFKGIIMIIISHDNNTFGEDCIHLRLENGVLIYDKI